jgi:ankyrin repeat protein
VAVLVAAGADVNARFAGPHRETPLHWAASSNDVDVLDALLDAGADIEADGAVIAHGTALADATAFGQWAAARRLIERGAAARLGEAASLGLLDRVDTHLATDPGRTEVTSAFWMACHGGQRATAEVLLDHGADLNWIGYDGLTPLDAAHRSGAAEVVAWLRDIGARSTAPDAHG